MSYGLNSSSSVPDVINTNNHNNIDEFGQNVRKAMQIRSIRSLL